MANYDNEITGQLTVDFSIFGNHIASEDEQVELKVKLVQAIEGLNIGIVGDVFIKVTDATPTE